MTQAVSMTIKRALVILRQRERALELAKAGDDTKVKPEIRKPSDAVDLMKQRAAAQKPNRRFRAPSVNQAINFQTIKKPAKSWRNRYWTDNGFVTGGSATDDDYEHLAKRIRTLDEKWPDGSYPSGEFIDGPTIWPTREIAEEAGREFCDPDTWNYNGRKPRFSAHPHEVE